MCQQIENELKEDMINDVEGIETLINEDISKEQQQEDQSATTDEIKALLIALDKKFDTKISTDEWKNQKYDEMHSLMLKHQEDSFQKTVNPLLKSLIQLSDSVLKDIKYQKSIENNELFVDTLIGIDEQIQSILFDYDIEFEENNEELNAKHYLIVKAIPTDNEMLNNKVAETLSRCYMRGENVFRVGRVNVYKYNKPEEETGNE